MNRTAMTLVAALTSCAALAASATAQTFTGLGRLPGGVTSYGQALSADGSVAIGYSDSTNGIRAFRWTAAGGGAMTDLGVLPGGTYSYAYGVSSDGSVIVGYGDSPSPLPATGSMACSWTSGAGAVILGRLPNATTSAANAVSGNGSVIVGTSGSPTFTLGFEWTAASAVTSLGVLPGGGVSSAAYAASYDGSVIAGLAFVSGHWQAFRWTSAGMASLDALPGGANSYGYAISSDGQVVVGSSESFGGLRAFRWTSAGMANLGTLPLGLTSSGRGVSGDGSLVVGSAANAAGASRAFLWTAHRGMLDLNTYLPSLGVDLTGWTLTETNGISADGLTIVGTGQHAGAEEAWVATIPAQCGSADFNCDGDVGTDSDIEAFFTCLAGSCPPAPCTSTADFNRDGDVGTDADIESFFRVLAGGSC